MNDHYALLGVSKDATAIEIRKAYLREVFIHHPDKNPDNIDAAHAATIAINLAYEILSHDKARKNYDDLRNFGEHARSEDVSQQQAYAKAHTRYKESENEAKERIKRWFYERLGVRPAKRHRCYALQGNSTKLDNLLTNIDNCLGDKVWEYRIRDANASEYRMMYNIRVVLDPSKCGFREQHFNWVDGYYHGLFKPGTAEDTEHNLKIAYTWLGDILEKEAYSHKITIFFGVVGSMDPPWRCYLDLSVVLVIPAFDVFIQSSILGLSKFAKENKMEVATIFNELATSHDISPATLWLSKTLRKDLARRAENVLRVRQGLRKLPEQPL
jgi:hypothetical protein